MLIVEVTPDLLRLLSIPFLGYAAWSDYQVRRVNPRVWQLLIGLGGFASVWQITQMIPLASTGDFYTLQRLIFVPAIMAVISGLLLHENAIGGADGKALFTLGLLFPAIHVYPLPGVDAVLPFVQGSTGSLAVTILINGLVFGVFYALRMWWRNFRQGERSRESFVSESVLVTKLDDAVGQLVVGEETGGEFLFDLDVLRMYLRWRAVSLTTLLADGQQLREPGTVGETYAVGTGAIKPNDERIQFLPLPEEASRGEQQVLADGGTAETDSWGAERFLREIDHDAYGASAVEVRDALDWLCSHETVRVQPAYPLMVPLFLGLLAGLTIGDLVVLWMYLTLAP